MNNNSAIGTAGIMDESMNNDNMSSSSSATTNDDINDGALPESPPSDAANENRLGGSIATPA
eukprot:scaffold5384_cov73-Skeletonema_dohrnii-CCMP3373.AAC.2